MDEELLGFGVVGLAGLKQPTGTSGESVSLDTAGPYLVRARMGSCRLKLGKRIRQTGACDRETRVVSCRTGANRLQIVFE